MPFTLIDGLGFGAPTELLGRPCRSVGVGCRSVRWSREIVLGLRPDATSRINRSARPMTGMHMQNTDRTKKLCWGLIALAVGLRLIRYLHDRGFWLDEVWFVLNLVNKSVAELMTELDDDQFVPLGFLFTMKLIVEIAGRSGYTLRFLPLVSSVASVFIFYELAKRVLKESALPIALLLFAISYPLITYAGEAKIYGIDAAVAAGLALAAIALGAMERPGYRHAALFALLGAAAVWFSFPAAFVMAGAGLTLGARYASRREWRNLNLLVAAVAVWLVSFAVQMSILMGGGGGESQVPTGDLNNLQSYYQDSFFPWPPGPVRTVEWLAHFFFDTTAYFTSEWAAGLAVFPLIVGGIFLAKTKPKEMAILSSPLVITLMVSAIHFYPTMDRFMMFVGPAMLLIVAAGIDEIRTREGARVGIIWIVLLGLLLFQPAGRVLKQSLHRTGHEDARAAVARLDKNFQQGDFIYLWWSALPQYRFYSEDMQPDEDILVGSRSSEWHDMERDLKQMSGKSRVWIMLSLSIQGGDFAKGKFLLTRLEELGVRLDEFESEGVELLLYDLSAQEPVADSPR